MNLDPRTMLFSIVVVYALSVVSMYVAVTGRSAGVRQDGMRKWALAMFLETLLWMLIAARGVIPDVFSIVLANGLKAASHALILAAIFEFQQRQAPRWHYFVPIVLAMAMVTILLDDLKARIIWGGLIYGFQMVLIARALLSDKETRAGSAWRLLFAGVVGIALVLALRTAVGIFGQGEFAQPQSTIELHPVQILAFIVVMATALMGTIGFVLLVKERADRDIMHLAMTDSLTQIPNRRALMDYAARALARRSGAPLAFLMIDVDLFKNINDTYGHPMGDKVLQKIAGLLEERLRGHDFLGRYGGEEFCVIAPDTDAEGAMMLAEHLRVAIASALFGTQKGNITITISIGISLCPQNGTCELKDVLANADAALYTAKQTGRNKSVCH
jgi:diguanylate cyclase (GGDEF)-like protein